MASRHVHGSAAWHCKAWCFFLDGIRRKCPCISFLSSIKLNPKCCTPSPQHLAGRLLTPVSAPTALPKWVQHGAALLLHHTLSLDMTAF